jgi:hypothetical protein
MHDDDPRRRFQVFISSTFEDLREEREAIMQTLLRIDCIPAGMEMFPAATSSQWDLIRRMIDDSDYVVVVVAQRYGSMDSSGVSYTQKEFEYADRIGKPILVFPQELTPEENSALDPKVSEFRQRLTNDNRHVRFWQTTGQLPAYIAADLASTMRSAPRPEGWVRGGHAIAEHISVLRTAITAMMSSIDNRSTQIQRIDELVGSMSARLATFLTTTTNEKTATRAMADYMHVQQLKLDLNEHNPMFGIVADGLLQHPLMTLSNLAKGHASVADYQIGHANDLLISAITSRFDAVSNDDLGFWQSETKIDSKYRHAVYDAIRRSSSPIQATRIFVFPRRTLNDRANEIAAVLREQMSQGLAWAIAIDEDVSDQVEPDAALDFALFDSDRAVSYFRRYRRFEVTFHTNGRTHNDAEIERQVRTYRMLLTHCWLASNQFAASHLAIADEAALLLRTTSRTRALESVDYGHAKRLFPIVVESESAIRDSISQMLNLHNRAAAKS